MSTHIALSVAPFNAEGDCAICLYPLQSPVATHCGHRFCTACLEQSLSTFGPKCPICRSEQTACQDQHCQICHMIQANANGLRQPNNVAVADRNGEFVTFLAFVMAVVYATWPWPLQLFEHVKPG